MTADRCDRGRRQTLLALGSTALLSACGRSRDANTLRFWVWGTEGQYAPELLQGFRDLHPEIKLEVQALPAKSVHEKLLTAYAGDALPDVCQLGNTWVSEFAALDALEPLGGYLDSQVAADYFDGLLEANTVDGRLLGVPWYVDTRLLFYRTDILARAGHDRPPQTWDEWAQACAAIKDVVGSRAYSVLLPLNEFEPLLVLALQQQPSLLRDGGRYGNFRSPEFKRALQFYQDMFANGWAPRMTNTQISNVWTEFGRGFYSFYVSGPWNISEFRRRLPDQLQDDWMTAPMPGPQGPGISTAGGASLVIMKSARNKSAAWKLIEHLSTQESSRHLHSVLGNLPPRRSTWEHPQLAGDIYTRAFRTQLERVQPVARVPEWERIAQQLQVTGERVAQGVDTVDQAAARLDARVDVILEKRRWMLNRSNSK